MIGHSAWWYEPDVDTRVECVICGEVMHEDDALSNAWGEYVCPEHEGQSHCYYCEKVVRDDDIALKVRGARGANDRYYCQSCAKEKLNCNLLEGE